MPVDCRPIARTASGHTRDRNDDAVLGSKRRGRSDTHLPLPAWTSLLSGIREQAQFERLRDHLRAFPYTVVTTEDYEEAAVYFNRCREKGVQGSNTDFSICAVAVRNGFSIFTTEEDFPLVAKVVSIALHVLLATPPNVLASAPLPNRSTAETSTH